MKSKKRWDDNFLSLKEIWDKEMDTTEVSICNDCLYYTKNGKCKAFPKGIPEPILFNDVIHNRVVFGQKGDYIYTRKSK